MKVLKHLNHWLISNFMCSLQCCYQNDMRMLLRRNYEVICSVKPLYFLRSDLYIIAIVLWSESCRMKVIKTLFRCFKSEKVAMNTLRAK